MMRLNHHSHLCINSSWIEFPKLLCTLLEMISFSVQCYHCSLFNAKCEVFSAMWSLHFSMFNVNVHRPKIQCCMIEGRISHQSWTFTDKHFWRFECFCFFLHKVIDWVRQYGLSFQCLFLYFQFFFFLCFDISDLYFKICNAVFKILR